ncbi:hypothetical protein [Rufibacter ruber]|uniref:hypothetical protein n=1 Tax=Rufibacter ruber TaxID=1783499 RepID=UPI00082AEDA6|nr:hypothetical protein [Rufibacter ruber]
MNPLLNWLHLPVFCLLVYGLWRLGGGKQRNLVFWASLVFKLCCGLLLGWLYQRHLHGGDTWEYHRQALPLVELAKTHPQQYLRFLFLNEVQGFSTSFAPYSNSFFFLKPLSLLYLLTGGSYWASGLYFSLFSFAGCWFLVRQVQKFYPAYGTAAVLAFLFFPSALFWTSGVFKDSILMGSLCFSVGFCLQLAYAHRLRESGKILAGLLPAVYLFWKIKFFLAAVLVVLLGTFLLVVWLRRRMRWLQPGWRQFLLWITLLGMGAAGATFAHPTFNLSYFARHVLWNYRNILAASDPSKPHLLFPDLEPAVPSLVQHAPEAVVQMLVRPFVWEGGPIFYRLAGLENLLILALLLLTVVHLLKTKKLPPLPSFLAVLLVFFVISAVLVTLPTPNLGSLHRYRAPLLPFFLMVVLAWGPIPGWFAWLQKRRG